MIRHFLKLVFFFLVTSQLHSQTLYPTQYFISPLDIPIKLSGTFGELRSDHFHSGIDIKTGEVEGLNVYAIADGYVSRIKIQSGGYGKALYITHPNGFVSVYGHLSRYNDEIGKFVKEMQYEKELYELDLYLPEHKIEVAKGEIVAFSGNTGRSGGPHLHFEIRDEASQMPVNPLLFGYRVIDGRAPVINLLKVYPYGQSSLINGSNKPVDYYPVASGQTYSLKNTDTIMAGGPFYVGINTVDLFNGGLNRNGVYKITLRLDSTLIYEHDFETFSFYETRYINSLIDYAEYKKKHRQVQRTYVQPNNQLDIYGDVINHGLITIPEGEIHRLTYVVSDLAGNESVFSFPVKGMKEGTPMNKAEDGILLDYSTENKISKPGLSFVLPEGALYDTLLFYYHEEPSPNGSFSPLYCLHNEYTPIQKYCSISINADAVPESLLDKAIIAARDDDGEFESAGGNYEDGSIQSKIRSFGKYCILVDTVAPEIIPVNIENNKSLLAQHNLKMIIKDELSGIRSYRGTLNGKWILMEYDEKNDLLTYYFDKHLQEGDNLFELTVTDEKDNQSVYRALLKY